MKPGPQQRSHRLNALEVPGTPSPELALGFCADGTDAHYFKEAFENITVVHPNRGSDATVCWVTHVERTLTLEQPSSPRQVFACPFHYASVAERSDTYDAAATALIITGLTWSPEAGLVTIPFTVTASGEAAGSGWGGVAARMTESMVNEPDQPA